MTGQGSLAAEAVTIFTDGACVGNPGPGGFAALLKRGHQEKVVVGRETGETTNNRMELTAVIAGVEALFTGRSATLYSDSEYSVRGWERLPGWKAKGWRRADKKPVLNRDLWERLEAAMSERDVTLHWIKGHAGHPDNERVDKLAEAEAREAAERAGWAPGARFGFT